VLRGGGEVGVAVPLVLEVDGELVLSRPLVDRGVVLEVVYIAEGDGVEGTGDVGHDGLLERGKGPA